MAQPLIYNIQKFSIHDGPGIRTTIFFKGCPIRCAWCHNPESQSFHCEEMLDSEGNMTAVGKEYSVRALVKEIEKDQIFYDQSGGGVTFSGGEVMAQDIEYIETVARECQRKGISVVVDTSGEAAYESFQRMLPYTDLFLYDLKMMDEEKHKKWIGVSNNRILSNLIRLSEDGATINLRLPLIAELNDSIDDMQQILTFLETNKISIDSVNLLPYHDYGRGKYTNLNRQYPQNLTAPAERVIEALLAFWSGNGYHVGRGGAAVSTRIGG